MQLTTNGAGIGSGYTLYMLNGREQLLLDAVNRLYKVTTHLICKC